MKCEICSKEKKGKWRKKYCSETCYDINFLKTHCSLCKCGNKKYLISKKCRKCFLSNKHKGQVSRSPLK